MREVELPEDYLALDLSALSSACEQPLDGLLGADFLRDRIVQIDFATQTIRILESVSSETSQVVLPMDVRHCGIRVQARVNDGSPQWMRLDTGCVSALEWVTRKVKSADCGAKVAVGLTEISIPQITTTVDLGSSRFGDVPTGLHRKPIFPGESGLLGMGLLSRFQTVTIDAPSKQLILGRPRGSN
jgi:hypothetical protein